MRSSLPAGETLVVRDSQDRAPEGFASGFEEYEVEAGLLTVGMRRSMGITVSAGLMRVLLQLYRGRSGDFKRGRHSTESVRRSIRSRRVSHRWCWGLCSRVLACGRVRSRRTRGGSLSGRYTSGRRRRRQLQCIDLLGVREEMHSTERGERYLSPEITGQPVVGIWHA